MWRVIEGTSLSLHDVDLIKPPGSAAKAITGTAYAHGGNTTRTFIHTYDEVRYDLPWLVQYIGSGWQRSSWETTTNSASAVPSPPRVSIFGTFQVYDVPTSLGFPIILLYLLIRTYMR